mgnify:CR=1 FL=1
MKNKKNKMLVTKDNRLVAAHYKLTAQEQKLVLTVVAMIQPTDADFQEYLVPVDEFKRLMGVEGRAYHLRLKQRAKSLLRKPLEIPQDDGGWLIANWFSSIKESPQEACVRIRFDPNLKPYLLSLKNQFTTFELHSAAKLSSAYSIRLYELLKQYENTDIKERTFEFAALKKILGCESTYAAYGNFNQRVLQPAQKELSEKTDIGFTYKVRKIGRRVNWIVFTIRPRKKVFIDDGHGSEIDTADVISPSDIPVEIVKWIPEGCRSQHDVLRDILTFTETHGLPYVVQKVAYTAKRKPKDFAAYLGNALKKNLGADFDPNQLELFSESALLPKIAPGMRVVYEGREYTIDETECIWPEESDGCMTSGRIRELIGAGTIQIV